MLHKNIKQNPDIQTCTYFILQISYRSKGCVLTHLLLPTVWLFITVQRLIPNHNTYSTVILTEEHTMMCTWGAHYVYLTTHTQHSFGYTDWGAHYDVYLPNHTHTAQLYWLRSTLWCVPNHTQHWLRSTLWCVQHTVNLLHIATLLYYTMYTISVYINDTCNESTAGADASVEASYNVASKKKPGDRSSDSWAVATT